MSIHPEFIELLETDFVKNGKDSQFFVTNDSSGRGDYALKEFPQNYTHFWENYCRLANELIDFDTKAEENNDFEGTELDGQGTEIEETEAEGTELENTENSTRRNQGNSSTHTSMRSPRTRKILTMHEKPRDAVPFMSTFTLRFHQEHHQNTHLNNSSSSEEEEEEIEEINDANETNEHSSISSSSTRQNNRHSNQPNNSQSTPSHELINIDTFYLICIFAMQNIIEQCLQAKHHNVYYAFYLQQSDVSLDYDKQEVTVRFKIVFPYCHIKSIYLKQILFPELIKELRRLNSFRYLPYQPLNDWDTIIDHNIADIPHPLYYSISKSLDSPYLLDDIYAKMNSLPVGHENDGSLLTVNFQNITPKAHSDCIFKHFIDERIFYKADPYTGSVPENSYWLPIILSLNFWSEFTPLQDRYSRVIGNGTPVNFDFNLENSNQVTPIEIAAVMLTIISPVRATQRDSWLTIGKALYNVYNADLEPEPGLAKFIDFTKTYSQGLYTEKDCGEVWDNFRSFNYYNEKTLGYMARSDNKVIYQKWHEAWCYPFLKEAVDCTHYKVANALYHLHWLDYACPLPKKMKFYRYNGHRWDGSDADSKLRLIISNEFVTEFARMRAKISHQVLEIDNPNERSSLEKYISSVSTLIKKLETNPFKNSIMKEVADLFNVGYSNFTSKLDSNPYLLAVPNGIIELTDKEAVFRQGLPGDMVKKCGRTYWDKKMSYKHPKVRAVMKWMKQFFYYDDLMDHFLCLMASTMKSGNDNKIFPVLVGAKGNNGKSKLKKMMEEIFGEYLINFRLEVFGSKKSNSGPSPELARAAGAKQAWLQEADDDDNLRNGPIKEATGGDSFYARNNNEDGGDIVSTFTLIMQCNSLNGMKKEKAMVNRLRIIPCESIWVDPNNPEDPLLPETEEEQMRQRIFQVDPKFDDKIREMAPGMLWILVQYYKKYLEHGLETPNSVKQATSHYWKSHNIYLKFCYDRIDLVYKFVVVEEEIFGGEININNNNNFNNNSDHTIPIGNSFGPVGEENTNANVDPNNPNVRKVLDANFMVDTLTMWDEFKDWYRASYTNMRQMPNKDDFLKGMVDLLGNTQGNCWYGLRVKDPETDVKVGVGGGAGGAGGAGMNASVRASNSFLMG